MKNQSNKPNKINPHTENSVTPENNELFDVINPYPAGHPCFRIYEKTSQESKKKMRTNIKINAHGNIEMMGREFFVLHAAPNGKDILEKNWITFFLWNAWQREAEKQWCTLFDTPEQADKFIDSFIWGNEEKNKKIRNIMRIFWLYWPEIQTWFYGWRKEHDSNEENRKRSRSWYKASYAVLTKTYDNEKYKYWVEARLQVEADNTTKTIVGVARPLNAEFGYPAIVSRPV